MKSAAPPRASRKGQKSVEKPSGGEKLAAALRRRCTLQIRQIWRGKPAATRRHVIFSAACYGPVILSDAKDLCSSWQLFGLTGTAEILRFAQDDDALARLKSAGLL